MRNRLQWCFSTVLQPLHFAVCAMVIIASSYGAAAFAQNAAPTPAIGESKLNATITTLQKNDKKQGTGAEAVSGKAVVVHYTGWLY